MPAAAPLPPHPLPLYLNQLRRTLAPFPSHAHTSASLSPLPPVEARPANSQACRCSRQPGGRRSMLRPLPLLLPLLRHCTYYSFLRPMPPAAQHPSRAPAPHPTPTRPHPLLSRVPVFCPFICHPLRFEPLLSALRLAGCLAPTAWMCGTHATRVQCPAIPLPCSEPPYTTRPAFCPVRHPRPPNRPSCPCAPFEAPTCRSNGLSPNPIPIAIPTTVPANQPVAARPFPACPTLPATRGHPPMPTCASLLSPHSFAPPDVPVLAELMCAPPCPPLDAHPLPRQIVPPTPLC